MVKTDATFKLSFEDLQKFQDSGIAGPFRLLTDHETETVLSKLRLAKAKLFFWHRVLSRSLLLKNFFIAKRWGKAKWEKGMHLVSPVTYALSTNPVILNKIESILGPNLLLWGSMLISQRPNEQHRWHLDADCLDCDGITVWLALKNINEMTALKVITRSHHLPVHPKQLNSTAGLDTSDDNAVLQSAREFDPTCELKIVNIKPGKFVILSGRTWHSTYNRSQSPRYSIIFQYSATGKKIKMPADNSYPYPFVWDTRPVACCLVRGTDEYGRNPLVRATTASE